MLLYLRAAAGRPAPRVALARRAFSTSPRALTSAPAPLKDVYDIVVVGAGVVGASFAARAANHPVLAGASIAVIEPRPSPPLASLRGSTSAAPPPPDLRVFALTPASRRALEAAGAWNAIESFRAPSFDAMQVWDALGGGHIRFSSSDVEAPPSVSTDGAPRPAAPPLGYIAENGVLQSALWEVLQAQAAAGKLDLVCPGGVRAVALPDSEGDWLGPPGAGAGAGASGVAGNLASITLEDGRVIKARLVVGADGAASKVRSSAGIGTWGWDYDQRGVVATVRLEGGAGRTAWQRFLPNGPVAVLPLWDDLASIVWSTSPAHAAKLTALSPAAFTEALNTVLRAPRDVFRAALEGADAPSASSAAATTPEGAAPYEQARHALSLNPLSWLGSLGHSAAAALAAATSASPSSSSAFAPPPYVTETLGPRASFPLKLAKANAYVRPRVALIGDAAHSIHPLAGQGLNLGIGDADELLAALSRGAAAGADLGSLSALQPYESARARHNLVMMAGIDGIKRVFSPTVGGHVVEPWLAARNLGLALANAAPPVKTLLASVAMGNPLPPLSSLSPLAAILRTP